MAAPLKAISNLENWKPKTELGRKVKNKEITNINDILEKGLRILEGMVGLKIKK